MKNNERDVRKKEQNRDAWYGMVHVKDRSYIHQRSLNNFFYNKKDPDIFVPATMTEADGDGKPAGKRFFNKALKIVGIVLVVAFIVGMLIYILVNNPELGAMKPNNHYKW